MNNSQTFTQVAAQQNPTTINMVGSPKFNPVYREWLADCYKDAREHGFTYLDIDHEILIPCNTKTVVTFWLESFGYVPKRVFLDENGSIISCDGDAYMAYGTMVNTTGGPNASESFAKLEEIKTANGKEFVNPELFDMFSTSACLEKPYKTRGIVSEQRLVNTDDGYVCTQSDNTHVVAASSIHTLIKYTKFISSVAANNLRLGVVSNRNDRFRCDVVYNDINEYYSFVEWGKQKKEEEEANENTKNNPECDKIADKQDTKPVSKKTGKSK